MANEVYSRLLTLANRLIRQYGKPAVIRRNVNTGEEYNPTLTPVDYDVMFVETGYKISDRDGTQILEGDLLGLISMDGQIAVLERSDQLIANGRTFELVDVLPLNPGGIQLLSEIQAR